MVLFTNPPVVVPTVYAAIELSKKSWVIAVAHPDRNQPSLYRIAGGRLDALAARLQCMASEGERLLSGYDGFWLARSLASRGIACRVLDPASLQVNRRARRAKTDRIDVLMLLRALIAIDRGDRHVAAIVRVPSVEEEDARRSHRERQRLIRERTTHINGLKGLLFARVSVASSHRCDRDGSTSPHCVRPRACPSRPAFQELEREYARLDLVENQLRAVESERDVADAQDPLIERKGEMLMRVRSVGAASAAILTRELFIHRRLLPQRLQGDLRLQRRIDLPPRLLHHRLRLPRRSRPRSN
jgi:transposase